MDWLLFLLLPGALMVWGQSHMEGKLFLGPLLVLLCSTKLQLQKNPMRKPVLCNSCDEFNGKVCRRNSRVCKSRYPDFACQTKKIYTPHFTGEYLYQYSILGCPKRCVEYVRLTNWEKTVFSCCNKSYCNTLSKGKASYNFFPAEDFP